MKSQAFCSKSWIIDTPYNTPYLFNITNAVKKDTYNGYLHSEMSLNSEMNKVQQSKNFSEFKMMVNV